MPLFLGVWLHFNSPGRQSPIKIPISCFKIPLRIWGYGWYFVYNVPGVFRYAEANRCCTPEAGWIRDLLQKEKADDMEVLHVSAFVLLFYKAGDSAFLQDLPHRKRFIGGARWCMQIFVSGPVDIAIKTVPSRIPTSLKSKNTRDNAAESSTQLRSKMILILPKSRREISDTAFTKDSPMFIMTSAVTIRAMPRATIPWPQNITQLKRILRQAFLNSNASYLSVPDIRGAMRESGSEVSAAYGSFNLDQPLRSIEKQIINYVLKEENFNQTTTAKRLEISRTTLWRLLNE